RILDLIDDLNKTMMQDEKKLEHHASIEKAITFEDYLSPKAKKIIPFLVEKYGKAKPKVIAYMIFALMELKFLEVDFTYLTEFASALGRSFSAKISRQILEYHFKKRELLDDEQKMSISKMAKEIEKE